MVIVHSISSLGITAAMVGGCSKLHHHGLCTLGLGQLQQCAEVVHTACYVTSGMHGIMGQSPRALKYSGSNLK